MSENRIAYLRAQIVGLGDVVKSMGATSPARLKLEDYKRKAEEELDILLKKPEPPKTEPLRQPARSALVDALSAQIQAARLPKPQTEVRFHPTRKWRLDLAWPDIYVGVEVHGGIWTEGRHTRGAGFQADREKMNEAALLGWLVLEVTGDQIRSGQALAWVESALNARKGEA
jgi:hypothetical protein